MGNPCFGEGGSPEPSFGVGDRRDSDNERWSTKFPRIAVAEKSPGCSSMAATIRAEPTRLRMSLDLARSHLASYSPLVNFPSAQYQCQSRSDAAGDLTEI